MPSKTVFLFSAVATASLVAGSPAPALAGPPDGLGIGPRVENYQPGLGIDYWAGPLGVSLAATGDFSWRQDEREESGEASSFDEHSYAVSGSAAVFGALASTDSTRIALGGRLRFERYESGLGDPDYEWRSDKLALEVPVRLQWRVTERMTVHTEVGLGVERSVWRSRYAPDGELQSEQEDTEWTVRSFASPWSNFGVTYYF